MYGNSLRLEPVFEGEGSMSYYGKSNEALSRVTQKFAMNGYTTAGKNFVRRCGFTAVYRSSNKLQTFTIDDARIGLIEDAGDQGVYFSVYSSRTGLRLKAPVLNPSKFEDFSDYNELTFRSGDSLLFSVRGGLYTVNLDNTLVTVMSKGTAYHVETYHVASPFGESLSAMFYKVKGMNSIDFSDYRNNIYYLPSELKAEIFQNYREAIISLDEYLAISGVNSQFPIGTFIRDYDVKKITEEMKLKYPSANVVISGATVRVGLTYSPVYVGSKEDAVLVNMRAELSDITFQVNNQFATISGVTNFAHSVFFNNRLLIFDQNKIYYSATTDPFDFSITTSNTAKDIIDKNTSGVLEVLKFYNTSGGLTNVISIADFVIFTTEAVTYMLKNNENSPQGISISIISNEGALAHGLKVIGHEIYKLSNHGLKKLMNYQYYSQIQEIDTTLYQPHIYYNKHTQLSFSLYRNEKYIYTLRDDGIIFCHTPIPVGLSSEYSYYILSSRYENKYFNITQIGDNFKSGICKLKHQWGNNGDNILFMYDHFDFNNDNISPYTIYDIGDLDNYFFHDLGICDHSTLSTNSVLTNDYEVDYVANTITIRMEDFVIDNKINSTTLQGLAVGDYMRLNGNLDFPLLESTINTIKLDISEGVRNLEFKNRIKDQKNISVNGKLYGDIKQIYIDVLKNIYKEDEPITKELQLTIDGLDGELETMPFDLYGKNNPNPELPYNPYGTLGLYFAVGLPFKTYLNIHTNTLDMPSTIPQITARMLLTTDLKVMCKVNHLDFTTLYNSGKELRLQNIAHKISVTLSSDSMLDFSNLYFVAYEGQFLCILSLVFHL